MFFGFRKSLSEPTFSLKGFDGACIPYRGRPGHLSRAQLRKTRGHMYTCDAGFDVRHGASSIERVGTQDGHGFFFSFGKSAAQAKGAFQDSATFTATDDWGAKLRWGLEKLFVTLIKSFIIYLENRHLARRLGESRVFLGRDIEIAVQSRRRTPISFGETSVDITPIDSVPHTRRKALWENATARS